MRSGLSGGRDPFPSPPPAHPRRSLEPALVTANPSSIPRPDTEELLAAVEAKFQQGTSWSSSSSVGAGATDDLRLCRCGDDESEPTAPRTQLIARSANISLFSRDGFSSRDGLLSWTFDPPPSFALTCPPILDATERLKFPDRTSERNPCRSPRCIVIVSIVVALRFQQGRREWIFLLHYPFTGSCSSYTVHMYDTSSRAMYPAVLYHTMVA